ncbi:MAG: sensor histidine kinase [Prevotella sp.]
MIALILAIALVVVMGLYIHLWLRYRKHVHQVAFLFKAISNGDYSYLFHAKSSDKNERQLVQSLNRVKEVLQRARDEQIQRERYYEQILDAVDTGILVIDDERGLVLQHNQAASRLLQRDPITHVCQIKTQLHDFAIRDTYTTLKDRRVRIVGFSDIKGELARQEIDTWVKLIRVLTHEIMNTLTPVISLSKTLLDESEGACQEGLQVIYKTSNELIAFVDNYRKFTHLPHPVPDTFYLKPFLERMATLAAHDVEVRVLPKDLMVYADEGLIARVVSNLLKNATEAIDTNGHIAIHAYTDAEERIIIDVTNDGAPLPPEIASNIFVPFFTTKQEGSGIGLSISRQIMGMSNGSISLVESEGKTTFRLVFN